MGDKLQTDSNGHVMPTGHNLDLIVEKVNELAKDAGIEELELEDE